MIVSDNIPVEQEKLLRHSSHEDFIRKCIRERIVPNGFTLKWNIQMGADCELQRKCEKVKLDASMKLMEITAEACRRNIQNLGKHEKYVNYSEISLRDNGPLSQKKHELEKIKNKKLERLRRCQFDVDSNEFMPDRFAILRTVPDGNCFYRCISLEIHGVENKHEAVRKAVVTHMQSNYTLCMWMVITVSTWNIKVIVMAEQARGLLRRKYMRQQLCTIASFLYTRLALRGFRN